MCPLFLSLSPVVDCEFILSLGSRKFSCEVLSFRLKRWSKFCEFVSRSVGLSKLPCRLSLEFVSLSVISLSININIIGVLGWLVNNFFKII